MAGGAELARQVDLMGHAAGETVTMEAHATEELDVQAITVVFMPGEARQVGSRAIAGIDVEEKVALVTIIVVEANSAAENTMHPCMGVLVFIVVCLYFNG